ncbi:hypothetical protein SeMB42_g00412 [Synchytrium endobioticum]|uniref:Uncharacterized protein n=1 Tax=Synchytrium endobioticum TaxID=286115 RepID=A0A507DTJ7_9FUNG|nr:hypothetical protein SeMB42_g00412 [Synchytrium endobioticum]
MGSTKKPYIVKYGGARVKAVSQIAKPHSLTAVEIGDLETRAYSHTLVVWECNRRNECIKLYNIEQVCHLHVFWMTHASCNK